MMRKLALVWLFMVSGGVGLLAEPPEQGVLKPVLMPGADFVMVGNAQAIRGTPIQKDLKSFLETQRQKYGAGNASSPLSLIDDLRERLGLREGALKSFVFAIDLDDMNEQGTTPFEQLNILFGFELQAPLDLDRITTAIEHMNREQPHAIAVRHETYAGVPCLVLTDKAGDQSRPVQQIHLALIAGNQALLLGSQKGLRQALDRLADDQMADLSEALRAVRAAAGRAHVQMLLVPTASMRANLKKQAQDVTSKGNFLLAKSLELLSGMAGSCLSFTAAETLEMALTLAMQDAGSAQALKLFVDTVVMSMGKFALAAAVGPSLPMLQTFKTGLNDKAMIFSLALSRQDLEQFRTLRNRKAVSQASPSAP